MNELLRFTMFQNVLFPADATVDTSLQPSNLKLNKLIRFNPTDDQIISNATIVIFDFETTGLDHREDQIIEIGAQRICNGEVTGEFSTLVRPDNPISDQITKITGITNSMLEDQPNISEIMPKFLQFIEGAYLSAHNAEFDMAFLAQTCMHLGYQINWPCFCTLKLSRVLLPKLESRSLDALAKHYGLTFEARHRSIGDVKVTRAILDQLLQNEGSQISTWKQLQSIAGIKE